MIAVGSCTDTLILCPETEGEVYAAGVWSVDSSSYVSISKIVTMQGLGLQSGSPLITILQHIDALEDSLDDNRVLFS